MASKFPRPTVFRPQVDRVLVHFGSPQGTKYCEGGGFVNGR